MDKLSDYRQLTQWERDTLDHMYRVYQNWLRTGSDMQLSGKAAADADATTLLQKLYESGLIKKDGK